VPVVRPRFLIEAGFIIAVAVVAGLSKLSTAWIVAVIAAAWLIVAVVEIAMGRRRTPATQVEPTSRSEPLTEPERPRPEIVAGPAPAPEPEPQPEQVVVAAVPRHEEPREWNLWDLERLARQESGGDVARDEERTYLLMYLREFAGADGNLPVDFDRLVRDAFADLLHAAAT
jgi:hypothetical protein